jgi:hypothetical protein
MAETFVSFMRFAVNNSLLRSLCGAISGIPFFAETQSSQRSEIFLDQELFTLRPPRLSGELFSFLIFVIFVVGPSIVNDWNSLNGWNSRTKS